MAFATQNVQLASIGDSWRLIGKCTSSVGAADGTISVGGAMISLINIADHSDSTPSGNPIPFKVSTNSTTGISTITVNASNGITNGRFQIVYR